MAELFKLLITITFLVLGITGYCILSLWLTTEFQFFGFVVWILITIILGTLILFIAKKLIDNDII